MQKLLSPKTDFVFKFIFGSENHVDILKSFLQAILDIPAEEYQTITFVDPHLQKTYAEDKLGILDIKLKLKSGKLIDIEMQVCSTPDLRERIVYYSAKMLTGQAVSGGGYGSLKKSISIVIADFTLIKDAEAYHNRYVLHDPRSGSIFSDIIEVHTLEIPKSKDDGSLLSQWLMFFKAKSKEEYMEIAEKSPAIGKSVGIVMELSDDERAQLLAESREKLEWDIASIRRGAYNDGIALGREEGEKSGMEKVLALLRQGLSLEEIERQL